MIRSEAPFSRGDGTQREICQLLSDQYHPEFDLLLCLRFQNNQAEFQPSQQSGLSSSVVTLQVLLAAAKVNLWKQHQ